MTEKQRVNIPKQADSINEADLFEISKASLAYAREREYRGYDKHDGLSNIISRKAPFKIQYIDIALQETVKRSPLNIRPLLLVEKKRNMKGAALFSHAYQNLYSITGEEWFLDEALTLADWLVDNSIEGYSGFCVGHRHPIVNLERYIPPKTPGIVSTSYAVESLTAAGKYKASYLDAVCSAPNLIFDSLNYTEIDDRARIDYKPSGGVLEDAYILNANALGARLLTDIQDAIDDAEYTEEITRILDYVADNQDEIGGWEYTDPSSASAISMDTYHNGFIIESFLRYQDVIDEDRYTKVVEQALDFYRRRLFSEDGGPHWDERKKYPQDIHAAAQGIIIFSLTGNFEFAKRIIEWTMRALHAGNGKFYYQKRKYYTKRITLMRWCQAWIAYSISAYLKNKQASVDVYQQIC